MRFRKRVKVFPGFYLNFSNSGISSTIGIKGASINFSKKGTYLNTGIPGTGIYNRQKIGGEQNGANSNQNIPSQNIIIENPSALNGEIKSVDAEQLTSTSFIEFKNALVEVYADKVELVKEIEQTIKDISSAKFNNIIACIFLIGFFVKSFKIKIEEKEEYLIDLQNQLKNSFINIDLTFENAFEEAYLNVLNNYKNLLTSEIIWDITSSVQQDMKAARSSASSLITRQPVKFKFDNIDIIKSIYPAFHFENKNGGDLYIYPAFVVILSGKKEFGIVDIKDFELMFSQQRFLEEGKIPSDTKIIDKTWAKVNKNGTPDKRFTNNYQIPIVRYGEMNIKSNAGLNESYAFSNFEKSEDFAISFTNYQNMLKK